MSTEEIFYLIRNINGLEEIVESGRKKELEELKLYFKSSLLEDKKDDEIFLNITYYIVPKEEWDLQSCPLFPVDFP